MVLPKFGNDSSLVRCDPTLLFGLSSQECLQLVEIHVCRCNRLKDAPHLRQKGAELLEGHLRIELAPQQLLRDALVPVESFLGQAAQQPAQRLGALELGRHAVQQPRPPQPSAAPATAAGRGPKALGEGAGADGGDVPTRGQRWQLPALIRLGYTAELGIQFQKNHFIYADSLHHARAFSNSDYH